MNLELIESVVDLIDLGAIRNEDISKNLRSAIDQTKKFSNLSYGRMIDVLMDLSKYRLLSKDEIAELVILRKAQE